jgi:hypothetical protein
MYSSKEVTIRKAYSTFTFDYIESKSYPVGKEIFEGDCRTDGQRPVVEYVVAIIVKNTNSWQE